MSGARSRNKGARGERTIAAKLEEALGVPVRRGVQSRLGGDASDVEGLPWHVEVKTQKRPNIHAAMAQAVRDTNGRVPVVITKRDREEALVTMTLDDWMPLAMLLMRQVRNHATPPIMWTDVTPEDIEREQRLLSRYFGGDS